MYNCAQGYSVRYATILFDTLIIINLYYGTDYNIHQFKFAEYQYVENCTYANIRVCIYTMIHIDDYDQ